MVKLFGRAFQIYDDVINLVEENFGNMKNGLGEDITEGKISYPIVYLLSRNKGRKNSIQIPAHNNMEQPSISEITDTKSNDTKKNVSLNEENEKDFFDVVNKSNVFSYNTLKKKYNTIENIDNSNMFKKDLEILVSILQEKTKDKNKISTAIQILKSKISSYLISRIRSN